MKTFLTAFCLFTLTNPLFAQIKVPIEKYIGLLNQGHYRDVYEDIRKFRKNIPYGKSAALDYFEAKCLCLNGTCENAYAIFTKIFQCYPLADKDKNFLYGEMETCQGTQTPSAGISPQVVVIPVQIPGFASTIRGKLGDVTNCYDQNQFIDFSQMPSQDELLQRIFDKRQKKQALSLWRGILGDGYAIDTTSDRFIIITPPGEKSKEIAEAIHALQKAASFYSSYYQLSPPDKLITVIMMPSEASLGTAAKKVHQINLPSTNLGYSNLSDLSLLGVGDPTHVGTIYHELFHLMIKSDIGDIPVWLDEGLACLYSTYTWNKDTLLGSATWRTEVLHHASGSQDYALRYPSIKLLTSYTWGEFNGADDHNICKASINYAMANHLMLYFQERKWLQKIVAAYRDRPDREFGDSTAYPTSRQILENAIGEPLDTLEVRFSSWLKDKYGIYMSPNTRQSAVYPFEAVLEHSEEEQFNFESNGKGIDSANSFKAQLNQIKADYRQHFASSPDLKKFYSAEEDRLAGIYNPFTKSSTYKRIKQLYDQALALEVRIRATGFKK